MAGGSDKVAEVAGGADSLNEGAFFGAGRQ